MLYSYLLVVAIIATTALSDSPHDSSTCKSSADERECRNEGSDKGGPSKSIRIITREELEGKTGENGSEIWLSILGEVYDVTAGKSYYGKGMSYGRLAGTDCTVCYVSGIFTAEEAAKRTNELSDSMLPGVLEWVTFYATHKSYNFLGYLVDPRFYDENGEPTSDLVGFRKRILSHQK
jgi:predicted heme/steroid binding protein